MQREKNTEEKQEHQTGVSKELPEITKKLGDEDEMKERQRRGQSMVLEDLPNSPSQGIIDDDEQSEGMATTKIRVPAEQDRDQANKSHRNAGENERVTQNLDNLQELSNRTSLDDLQRWLIAQSSQTNAHHASQISLPLSNLSTSISDGSLQPQQLLAQGESLEQLTVQPENIPLPEPQLATRKRRPEPGAFMRWVTGQPSNRTKPDIAITPLEVTPPDIRPETQAYRNHINMIARYPPRLRYVPSEIIRTGHTPRMVVYDHVLSHQADGLIRTELWNIGSFPPNYEIFSKTLRTVPNDCPKRMILVEELSPHLINLLGATFHIPPPVFEAHLNRSGYGNTVDQHQNPGQWHTGSLVQGYSSVTWYRPVLPILPETSKVRARLIAYGERIIPCPFECASNHSLHLRSRTNILRNNLDLCPEPGFHHKGSQAEYPVGWEERVTVWTTTLNNCNIVILFLDPLPTVLDGNHQRSMPSVTTRKGPAQAINPQSDLNSENRSNRAAAPPLIVPRPLRNVPEMGQSTTTGAHPGPIAPGGDVSEFKNRSKKFGRSGTMPVQAAHHPREQDGPILKPTLNHGPFVPYLPVRGRASSSASYGDGFLALDKEAYLLSITKPTSTLEELDYFLQLPSKGKERDHDPFRGLLRTIHDDTQGFVDVIRTTLRRIREGMLDEDLMQRRVTFWRTLLYRLHFSLADFDQGLEELMHYAHESEIYAPSFRYSNELPSEKLAKTIRQSLQNCMELIDRSSDSLRGEMQIVDSRRSIAEAESVSKLTELAFIFIPLSCVASLFSMQVHELNGGVPLYQMVLVSIGFVTMAYAVRLSIRSSSLIEYKNNTLNEIREDAQLNYNEPIPTHVFLKWLGGIIGRTLQKILIHIITVYVPMILILVIVAAILSPIILLWLRHIDKGFKIVITLLVLTLDIALGITVMKQASEKFDIEAYHKAMIREYKREAQERKLRKEKVNKRQKKKSGLDPESAIVDSSENESNHDTTKVKGSKWYIFS